MNLQLRRLGWDESFQLSFETINDGAFIPARVIRENKGQYIVNTGDGESVARMSGVALHGAMTSSGIPTVGDWLAVERVPGSEDLVIHSILPRKSFFERQAAGNESKNQSVAANFDYLFLVSGLDGDFNLRRIQRYLSLAWNSQAQPVIILNKADLLEDLAEILSEVKKMAMGVPVFTISAMVPESLRCLDDFFEEGKTVVLLGSSGVGKSSLVNALLGEERLATRAIRAADCRGRHTTTWRELLLIPRGGMLIDLPGMRELQLTGESGGIEKTFADVERFVNQCRFRNCRHQGEPGCAVAEAIENGQLESDRYHQFMKLRRESSRARVRQAARKKTMNAKQKKNQDKERFFKEIAIQNRRNAKAKRKFDW